MSWQLKNTQRLHLGQRHKEEVPRGAGAAACCAAEEPSFPSKRERRTFPTRSVEEASFKTQNIQPWSCQANKTDPGPEVLLFSSGLKKIKTSRSLAPGSHDIHMAEVGNAATIFSPHFFVFAAHPHQQPTPHQGSPSRLPSLSPDKWGEAPASSAWGQGSAAHTPCLYVPHQELP